MNTLAWTTAFGRGVYIQMARLSVASLRRQGFTGRVVVLTDMDTEVEGAEVVQLESDKTGHMWKARILDTGIPLAEFDAVMFFDTDIVFTGAVDGLLALGARAPHVAQEAKLLRENPFNSTFITRSTPPLSPEWAGNMLNTGLLALPGASAEPWLVLWDKAWGEKRASIPGWFAGNTKAHARPQLFDQPVMQYLVCEGLLAAWPIPLEAVHYPALLWYWQKGVEMAEGCIGVHLNGLFCDDANKARVLSWMGELLDTVDPAGVCARISAEAREQWHREGGPKRAKRKKRVVRTKRVIAPDAWYAKVKPDDVLVRAQGGGTP